MDVIESFFSEDLSTFSLEDLDLLLERFTVKVQETSKLVFESKYNMETITEGVLLHVKRGVEDQYGYLSSYDSYGFRVWFPDLRSDTTKSRPEGIIEYVPYSRIIEIYPDIDARFLVRSFNVTTKSGKDVVLHHRVPRLKDIERIKEIEILKELKEK